MDKLKYVKLENPDGSYSESIPLSVSAGHVDITSGTGASNLANYISINDANVSNLKIQTLNLDSKINNNTSAISSLASGSPKGTYATTAALVNANPETGVYIITNNGHIYSWTKNDSTPIDLGVYQAASFETLYSNDSSGALTNGTIYKKEEHRLRIRDLEASRRIMIPPSRSPYYKIIRPIAVGRVKRKSTSFKPAFFPVNAQCRCNVKSLEKKDTGFMIIKKSCFHHYR